MRLLHFITSLLFVFELAQGDLFRRLPIGTCDANTPCANAACCGTNGLCGYSPLECGAGNCTSNCDAKAQCGQYAPPQSAKCPLNVCCSQFGFCGSTDDFCNTGCQQNYGSCGAPHRPSCGETSNTASKRTIGYYEAWSSTRKCQAVAPEDLNLNGFSHINFAFAFFDPATFMIAPMDDKTGELYSRFTALKSNKSGLQTWISVGGWSFTDPGPTRTAFSVMTSSAPSRASFIDGLQKFMRTYGFDGIDLDWEYPQADDRGGASADTQNYVALVKDMRAAFGTDFGISMTLPTSYWYLQHFDLASIQPHIDWFNLMAYDLHGVWDAESAFVGPYLAPHTNISEIDLGLDLLWRAGVSSDKVVLGQGWYGRSFTLADPSCSTPNGVCKFSGPADGGPCSGAPGILTYQEIQDVIKQNNLVPTWNHDAAVKWVSWSKDQWISYDDDDTFAQKFSFANNRCLGGTMVWAIDQKDQSTNTNVNGISSADHQDAQDRADDLRASTTCYTTDCDGKCKRGTSLVAQMNGQPGQLSTSDRCPKQSYRSLCCDDGTTTGECRWRGYRGAGLSCLSGCADGETELVKDTNSHEDHGDKTCTGGLQSYCCKGFRPVPSGNDLKQEVEDSAKAAAEAAAEQLALDVAAKAFCRIAVPALLAPLELLEDLIPIIGEILDIAEIAATPELINLCTQQVEKEGKAEFKVFGKSQSIDGFKKPNEKPKDRPSESSHSSAKTSSEACTAGRKQKRANAPARQQPCRERFTCGTIVTATHPGRTITQACNPDYTQPCNHYASVAAKNPRLYNNFMCPFSRNDRPIHNTREYYAQHADYWTQQARQHHGAGCDADEWPPGYFWSNEYNRNRQVWIRYVDSAQNQGAGQLWRCPANAENQGTSEDRAARIATHMEGGLTVVSVSCYVEYTASTFSMSFDGRRFRSPYKVEENDCRLPDDPGFALLTQDEWYDFNPQYKPLTARYANNHAKREQEWFDPDTVMASDGNQTRKMTDDELREELGFYRCSDSSCSSQLKLLGLPESIATVGPSLTAPISTIATLITSTVKTPVTAAASTANRMQHRPAAVQTVTARLPPV